MFQNVGAWRIGDIIFLHSWYVLLGRGREDKTPAKAAYKIRHSRPQEELDRWKAIVVGRVGFNNVA